MEIKYRSSEMEELLLKSNSFLKFYRKEKTEEAKENFKEAERQRHKQYYKENTKLEIQRTKEWAIKQSNVFITCPNCGVEIKKLSMYAHTKTKKQLANLQNEINKFLLV